MDHHEHDENQHLLGERKSREIHYQNDDVDPDIEAQHQASLERKDGKENRNVQMGQNQNQNIRNVRRNVARNVVGDVYVQPSRLFLVFAFLFYFPQILAVGVFLFPHWDTSSCTYVLQLWCLVHGCRLCFVLLCWFGLYHRSTVDVCMRVDRSITFLGLIWFIVGNIWFYRVSNASGCEHDTVYKLAQALLICAYIPFVLPILFVCISIPIIWCCLPSVISLLNYLMAKQRGADERLIQSLKKEKFTTGKFPADSAVCSICTNNYEPNEELHILPCKHHFHESCSTTWLRLNATCPNCRWDLKKPDGGRSQPQPQPQQP